MLFAHDIAPCRLFRRALTCSFLPVQLTSQTGRALSTFSIYVARATSTFSHTARFYCRTPLLYFRLSLAISNTHRIICVFAPSRHRSKTSAIFSARFRTTHEAIGRSFANHTTSFLPQPSHFEHNFCLGQLARRSFSTLSNTSFNHFIIPIATSAHIDTPGRYCRIASHRIHSNLSLAESPQTTAKAERACTELL